MSRTVSAPMLSVSILAKLALSTSILLLAFAASTVAKPLETLTPTQGQTTTTREIVKVLNERHYRDLTLNDEVSSRFLDSYIETLDPGKSFFFASDIAEFEKHRHRFDDDLKKGDLTNGFTIYNRYRERVAVRLEAIIARLQNEDLIFNFNENDELVLDIEQANWATDQTTANDLWHKRLKSNLLNIMLSDKTLAEAKKTLLKRYELQLSRLSQQNGSDVYETLINSLANLYDPHTSYLAPRTLENFNINMSLKLEGIGAVLRTEDEYTVVDRVVPGGPAHRQGELKPTDKIVAVGQANEELVDVVDWRLDDVVKLVRGERNTVVRLSVLSEDKTKKIVKITRDTVKLEEQAAKKAIINLTDGQELYKIGVIDLPTFYHDFEAQRNRDPNYRSTTRDVQQLLNELADANVDGVILDLRDNGGGSLQEATMLTDLFIDPGPVVQVRHSSDYIDRHSQSRGLARYRGPLIVLINRLSASASEIFAGAIQDYQRGFIVGNQSFGKGTVQSLTPVTEGQLKITESKFYRVSGDSTQHRGVVPDIHYPELVDITEIGESAYDNALPWDQIHEVPHAKYYNLAQMSPTLQQLHESRAKKDPDFIYLVDRMNLIKSNKDRKVVSLNEATRRKEQNELEMQSLAIENKRRLAKGLAPYKDMAAYRASDDNLDEEESESASSFPSGEQINPDKDPLLNETGYILVDYIKMLQANKVAKIANF